MTTLHELFDRTQHHVQHCAKKTYENTKDRRGQYQAHLLRLQQQYHHPVTRRLIALEMSKFTAEKSLRPGLAHDWTYIF